jgi:hypothetical protein
MNGVVEMLRVQGGLGEIRNELLVQMLVLYTFSFTDNAWLLIDIELITS